MSDAESAKSGSSNEKPRKTLVELLKAQPGSAVGMSATAKKNAQTAHTEVPTPVVKSKSSGRFVRQSGRLPAVEPAPSAAKPKTAIYTVPVNRIQANEVPTTETSQAALVDVIKELVPGAPIQKEEIKIIRPRSRTKPQWFAFAISFVFLGAGIAWVALTPPAAKESRTVRMDAPPVAVPASPKPQIKPVTAKPVAYEDPLVRAKAIFFDDKTGTDLEHSFVPPSSIHFTRAESYAVVFLQQPAEPIMKEMQKAGVQLIENYTPLISSFYVPDAKAFEALSAAPILGMCPLSEQSTKKLNTSASAESPGGQSR